ncbi:TRAP transporter large permease [Celeribacter naphthalenivorans]|uniref:TRAP transporter large permease n=1 Tax=Celeribacter naphthalenivorans TaxID=1614694 RepID=UPI001CF94E87|nr:TRAP transporter large permease subunit [Celeribacter naphthalenivorans]
MSLATEAIILIGLLTTLLVGGVWISMALAMVGWAGIVLFSPMPAGAIFATTSWGAGASWTLAALPLFIWMGEILFRTNLSEQLFRGIAPWVGRLPGGLLHINIFASGIFAAIAGSSAATNATVAKMALPELRRQGYPDSLILGSLAAGGTLGILIPPSVLMVVYASMTDSSIIRMFLAGFVPGGVLMLLFSLYIAVVGRHAGDKPPRVPLRQKLRSSLELLPSLGLILLVLGSMAAGLVTATEAAALGVAGALIVSAISGNLNWTVLLESLMGATRLSCMILFIVIGAATLTQAMAYTGIPDALARAVTEMGLSRYALVVALVIMYLFLGMFLDGASMIVLTASVVVPLVIAAGFDLIWFGIFITILVEIAAITPPVGFNLFVLEAMSRKSLMTVARASLPFVLIMLFGIAMLVAFPQIALWLPGKVLGN